jgi:hypothetical protein
MYKSEARGISLVVSDRYRGSQELRLAMEEILAEGVHDPQQAPTGPHQKDG